MIRKEGHYHYLWPPLEPDHEKTLRPMQWYSNSVCLFSCSSEDAIAVWHCMCSVSGTASTARLAFGLCSPCRDGARWTEQHEHQQPLIKGQVYSGSEWLFYNGLGDEKVCWSAGQCFWPWACSCCYASARLPACAHLSATDLVCT